MRGKPRWIPCKQSVSHVLLRRITWQTECFVSTARSFCEYKDGERTFENQHYRMDVSELNKRFDELQIYGFIMRTGIFTKREREAFRLRLNDLLDKYHALFKELHVRRKQAERPNEIPYLYFPDTIR